MASHSAYPLEAVTAKGGRPPLKGFWVLLTPGRTSSISEMQRSGQRASANPDCVTQKVCHFCFWLTGGYWV